MRSKTRAYALDGDELPRPVDTHGEGMISALISRVVSWWSKTPLDVIRKVWSRAAPLVQQLANGKRPDGTPLSGSEKFQIVEDAVIELIPENRQEVASNIIRVLVDLTLIAMRLGAIIAAEKIAAKRTPPSP